MGKQWKKAGKLESAAKKGAVISKIAREISVAARLGGGDPDMNSRLRLALEAARLASVPKDTVERAIKKGTGELEGGEIEEVMYEGYGPHQVGVLVECQTDNRNRTASEIRFIFKKFGGNIGELGSVQWMFERVSYVEASREGNSFDPEEEAIEAGANEVYQEEGATYGFIGSPEDLDQIQKTLKDRGWSIEKAELSFQAKTPTELSDEQKVEVVEFLDALDDNEDTHRLHATLEG